MTSEKQIAANRRNSRKSGGLKSQNGKLRSRQNAVRHGMSAESVIGVLEDLSDYEKFEAAIIADYSPRPFVEYELVVRLASLLWRLRRATSIETGLLQIHSKIIRERNASAHLSRDVQNVVYRLLKGGAQSGEISSKVPGPSLDKPLGGGFVGKLAPIKYCSK